MRRSIAGFLLLLSLPASAKEVTNIRQLGRHQRVILVEKSLNRQNVLAAYTELDDQCRFRTDSANRDRPFFGFYWLTNRSRFEKLSQSEDGLIRERMRVVGEKTSDPATTFYVALRDLKAMRHDIADPRMLVRSRPSEQKHCEVEGFVTLGPSDRNALIQMTSIYLELSFFGSVYAVTISGRDVMTGKVINHRYTSAQR